MHPDVTKKIGNILILMSFVILFHSIMHFFFYDRNTPEKGTFDSCLAYLAVVDADRLDIVKEICEPYYPTNQ